MSRLYVRVHNAFYTHLKTVRLLTAIGEAAYWVPPKLWAYAAENQPDGCFSQYAPQELAMLVAYKGDAQALLQALLQAGFMDPDPLRIHNWAEHNGYHAAFAERAKKAAAARWRKSPPAPPLKKEKEKEKVETSIASSINASSPDCNATSTASSMPQASTVLLSALGELYNRASDLRATYAEEYDASVVVQRSAWRQELIAIQAWFKATKAEDRKYLPHSMTRLLADWQTSLDRAHSNRPPPAKRWGTKGFA